MKHFEFIIAAYTVVWIVLACYIFILIRRNKRLSDQVDELSERIGDLEGGGSGGDAGVEG